jgi:hypothetical protein
MTEDERSAAEQLARALLASDRQPLVVVWCPFRHVWDGGLTREEKDQGWVFMWHPETGGEHYFPDNPGVVVDQESRGWQHAEPRTAWAGRRRRHAHRLARVYDMPDGVPVLCVPEFTILSRDLFEGRPDGPPVRFPTFAYPLGDSDRSVLARCGHGTYAINPVRLRDDVARARLRGETQHTIGSWTGRPGWPD